MDDNNLITKNPIFWNDLIDNLNKTNIEYLSLCSIGIEDFKVFDIGASLKVAMQAMSKAISRSRLSRLKLNNNALNTLPGELLEIFISSFSNNLYITGLEADGLENHPILKACLQRNRLIHSYIGATHKINYSRITGSFVIFQ